MSWWTTIRNGLEDAAGAAIGNFLGGPIGGQIGGSIAHNLHSNPGSGGGGSGNPVTAADPFADQRFQYQSILKDLMASQPTRAGDLESQDAMRTLAFSINTPAQHGLVSMQQMLTPGNTFQPSDPSYQFRFQQGLDAVNRGAAKSGMLGSGNQMAELMQYGQGMASQEFGAEFARQQAFTGTASQLEQQQFGMLSQVDQNQQNIFQNNYARLAQLSGANSGQPGQAGQLLASQQAGAAAMWQQVGGSAFNAIKSMWNTANGGDYSYLGSGGTGTSPDGSPDASYGIYSGTGAQAPVDLGMDW